MSAGTDYRREADKLARHLEALTRIGSGSVVESARRALIDYRRAVRRERDNAEQRKQGSLFGAQPEPDYRPSVAGSETSRDAALLTNAGRDRERILEYLRSNGPSTTDQIRQALRFAGASTPAARVAALRKVGAIEDSGRRARTSTGALATVWRLAGV